MLTTRRRLKDHLDRIEDSNLRELIQELISVASQAQSGARITSRKYRDLIKDRVESSSEAPNAGYRMLSQEELKEKTEKTILARGEQEDAAETVELLRLELQNFGPYYGRHAVDLSSDKTHNTVVFIGGNGAGKSTTFQAINWVLFSDEYLRDLRILTGRTLEHLINTHAIEDSRRTKTKGESSVMLWFMANGFKYLIKRGVEFQYLDVANFSHNEAQAQLYRIEDNGNHTELSVVEELPSILRDLPRTAREFYLFDGEQVDRFTSDNATERIRAAIEKIVGMEVINEALKDLRTVQRGIRSDIRKTNTNESFQELLKKIEETEARIEQEEDTIVFNQENLRRLSELIRKVENNLRNTVDTRNLQQERDNLAKSQQENETMRKTVLEKIQLELMQTYSCLAVPALNDFVSDLQGFQAEGTLAGGVNAGFLKHLLADGQCVCGRPLGHDTDAREHLQDLLEILQSQSSVDDSLHELRFALPSFISELESMPERLENSVREYSKLWEQRRQLLDRSTQISEELRVSGEADHERWEQERGDYIDQRVRAETEIAVTEHKLRDLREKYQEQQAEAQRLLSQSEDSAAFSLQAEWADAAVSVLETLDAEFATIARMEATYRTGELWRQLLPNVDQYDVQISDDFELKVTAPSGGSGMEQLSAGQRQCLGLAFITAIAQVAGTKPPIVIDMPFANLDDNTAAELASNLPLLADQLILFLLPGNEWREEIEEALRPYIASIIRLKQDHRKVSSYHVEEEV